MLKGEYKNILIVKPSSLGDIAQSLGVLSLIKARWPDARISWFVNSQYATLIDAHPLIDEVIPFDRDAWKEKSGVLTNLRDYVQMVRGLRARRFDLAIDLQGLFRSGLVARLSGARRRAGFSGGKEFAGIFYSDRVFIDSRLAAQRSIDLVSFITGRSTPVEPMLIPGADVMAACDRMLQDFGVGRADEIVVLCPGARWETKIWPAEYFAELARMLRKPGRSILVCGSADDHAFGETVCGTGDSTGIFNLCGRTGLKDLCAIFSRAAFCVTNDSGPMHMAAACKGRLIAIFGPTDPALTGPFSINCRIVREELDCVPCMKRQCQRTHEPLRCLRDITPDHVFAVISEFVSLLEKED